MDEKIVGVDELIRVVKAQVRTLLFRWRVEKIDNLDEDDLCQEALVFLTKDDGKILRAHDASRGPLLGFVRVVVTNRLKDLRRRGIRRKGIIGSPVGLDQVDEIQPDGENPEQRVGAREAVVRMHHCLSSKLRPHVLRTFLMRVQSGRSYREIAQLEGVSEATVSNRIQEARRLVARCARTCGIERPSLSPPPAHRGAP